MLVLLLSNKCLYLLENPQNSLEIKVITETPVSRQHKWRCFLVCFLESRTILPFTGTWFEDQTLTQWNISLILVFVCRKYVYTLSLQSDLSSVNLCAYPFLLNAQAKTTMLQTDAELQMQVLSAN